MLLDQHNKLGVMVARRAYSHDLISYHCHACFQQGSCSSRLLSTLCSSGERGQMHTAESCIVNFDVVLSCYTPCNLIVANVFWVAE